MSDNRLLELTIEELEHQNARLIEIHHQDHRYCREKSRENNELKAKLARIEELAIVVAHTFAAHGEPASMEEVKDLLEEILGGESE